MRFITGGTPTARSEIADKVLPAFLGYYERFPARTGTTSAAVIRPARLDACRGDLARTGRLPVPRWP